MELNNQHIRSGSNENVKKLATDFIKGENHKFIGKQGFTPPKTDNLTWIDLSSEISIKNLVVRRNSSSINNWLLVSNEWAPPHQTVITIGANARDNVVVFDSQCKVYGNITLQGTGSIVSFSETTRQPSSVNVAMFGRDEVFFWGKDSTSNGVSCDSCDDYGGIIIGDDCMFARGIWVRTSDQHAVFDINSMELLNKSASVVLEPHVWVGQDAAILKQSHIGIGSVVAAKALTNKTYKAYSLIAGIPGKEIKNNISWDRSLKPKKETMDRLKDIQASWA